MARRHVAALTAAILITTPAVGRPASTPSVIAPQATLAADGRDWPGDTWWRGYGDAQLTELIEDGLRDAPSVAAAAARLRRAEAGVQAVSAAQLPSLGATGNTALSKPSYNTGLATPPALHGWNDTGRLSLDFSYELDLWGRTRDAVAAATSDADASRADLATARLVVSATIAATYADYTRLSADRDVLASSLAVRERTLALVRRRVDAGQDSNAELRLAEAGPPAARAELAGVEEQLDLARLRLAALMGEAPDRARTITAPTPARLQGPGLPGAIPAELVGRRPDLAAARWRAEAAERRISVARKAYYPNVNLLGLIGLQSLGLGALTDAGSELGSAGAAINLPIFDGGRRRASRRAADAEYDAAVAAYNGALIAALEEVADAVASQRALDLRLAESRAALDASTESWSLASRRFAAGATDLQAVLSAEDRMLAARRAVAALEARRFVLDVALVRALGGGWRKGPDTLAAAP